MSFFSLEEGGEAVWEKIGIYHKLSSFSIDNAELIDINFFSIEACPILDDCGILILIYPSDDPICVVFPSRYSIFLKLQ